ncbi:MAG: metallophosphoesterase family protein [Saprospiraceae bacterium]
MRKILLVSDNHGYTSEELDIHIKEADEIWHAGDMGSLDSLAIFNHKKKILRGVYGNVDGRDIRLTYKETDIFMVAGIKVVMTHIGGYPGRYPERIQRLLEEEKPNLFICGHSHILKVMPDIKNRLLHMNPGAYGHHGFHVVRTVLSFVIDGDKIKDVKAIELGLRGRINE